MTFDLGVWNNTPANLAHHKAVRIYESLCRGQIPPELEPTPSLSAFYDELTARWPSTAVPWSSELHHSDRHVLLSCVWSRAEEVLIAVQELARKHNLVLYDPQSDELYTPES